ncbi:MAG: hypothetical protein Q9218_007652, partial [Villophora microphyllina]
MISITNRQVKLRSKSFKRLVLLYGPPGTGKSTLCRALAQKLAIRLKENYDGARLIEIDAAALFSKYFGESSKAVGRMFDKIEYLLDQEPKVFLCIIVDEIESLTASRQQSMGSNEPKDSMRVKSNPTFLQMHELKRLTRRHSNVMVFFTSNLVEAIDPAFLDRIDIRQHIPNPGTRTRYEIFRQCYLDLLECKVIDLTQGNATAEKDLPGRTAEEAVIIDEEDPIYLDEQASEVIPTYDAMQLKIRANGSANEFGVSEKLRALAGKSAASFNPTQIFADDVTQEKGENARLSAFVGAIAVGDLVKSTLGPKGMDKILQSASTGEIMVTNDGATILKSIALDNAAAKVLVNISKVQDDEVGDGTTSVAVLAAELLREAEKLVDRKLHPQTIIEG